MEGMGGMQRAMLYLRLGQRLLYLAMDLKEPPTIHWEGPKVTAMESCSSRSGRTTTSDAATLSIAPLGMACIKRPRSDTR